MPYQLTLIDSYRGPERVYGLFNTRHDAEALGQQWVTACKMIDWRSTARYSITQLERQWPLQGKMGFR
jgi:hypothetical protein